VGFTCQRKEWSPKGIIGAGICFPLVFLIIFLSILFLFTSIVQAQSIAPATLPTATVGIPYSIQLLAVGLPLPAGTTYVWSVVAGTLPPGLTLQPAIGRISGTPTIHGTFTFIIQVTHTTPPPVDSPFPFQQGFYLVVAPPHITFLAFSLPEAKEGSAYTGQIPVSGGTPPYTWSIVAGALPSGLRLDPATGIISGTPARGTPGTYSFTIKVTDSSFPALSAKQGVSLIVKKGFYEAIITIGSTLAAGETKVLIDGKEEVKLRGGETIRLSFHLGTKHTITVEREVPHPTKTDIRFKTDRDTLVIDEFLPNALFNYDAYYQLTVISPQGKVDGSGWYKADTIAKWSVSPAEIPMSGILGFFKGKLKPDYHSGSEIMDAPKTITVAWKPDYTMPAILIPLLFLLLGGATLAIYRFLRPPLPRPAIQPLPPPPTPPTVVVIERALKEMAAKTQPEATREQLLEKFGELLQKYEEEVKGTLVTEALPEAKPTPKIPRLPSPKEEPIACGYTSKNLLRTVVGNWRKKEEKVITPPEEKAAEKGVTITTIWARDIYNEWETFICSLPRGHTGNHHGAKSKAYTLQNTVTEERNYSAKQKTTPPKPHFTDELPVVDVAPHQVIAAESATTPEQVITPDDIPPHEPDDEE